MDLRVPAAELPFWGDVARMGLGWLTLASGAEVYIYRGPRRDALAGPTTHLNANGCGMLALPASIRALAALRILYLVNNQLVTLPAEIGALAALEVLDLDCNQLVQLPAEIWRLAALQSLCLTNNRLEALPAGIERMAALRILRLANNRLTALPAETERLAALRHINIVHNPVAARPVGVERGYTPRSTAGGWPQMARPREAEPLVVGSWTIRPPQSGTAGRGLADTPPRGAEGPPVGPRNQLPRKHARYTADGNDVECGPDDDDACAICLGRKRRPDVTPWVCAGAHVSWCSACAADWLSGDISTCPCCRAEIKHAE